MMAAMANSFGKEIILLETLGEYVEEVEEVLMKHMTTQEGKQGETDH